MNGLTQVGLPHCPRQIWAAGDVVKVLRLHFFLISFPMVEVVEVGYDDRYWQRNSEHTSNCAKRPDDFPPYSNGPIYKHNAS